MDPSDGPSAYICAIWFKTHAQIDSTGESTPSNLKNTHDIHADFLILLKLWLCIDIMSPNPTFYILKEHFCNLMSRHMSKSFFKTLIIKNPVCCELFATRCIFENDARTIFLWKNYTRWNISVLEIILIYVVWYGGDSIVFRFFFDVTLCSDKWPRQPILFLYKNHQLLKKSTIERKHFSNLPSLVIN